MQTKSIRKSTTEAKRKAAQRDAEVQREADEAGESSKKQRPAKQAAAQRAAAKHSTAKRGTGKRSTARQNAAERDSDAEHSESAPRRSSRGKKSVRVVRMALGLGVVAEKRFAPEEVIGEITGEIIDDMEYGSNYCMDMGDSLSLEPGPPFRFMNHSCEPNCELTWFDATTPTEKTKRRRIFVLALDEINSGEQLTIDYGWSADMAIRCRCQAAACRGWVVSEQELPKLLAEK